MKVEWDDAKNLANQAKHGISFDEAQEIFRPGVDCLVLFDDAQSEFEERFISIGAITGGLVLVVWTERNEDVVRIISARWATRRERRLYESHLEQRL